MLLIVLSVILCLSYSLLIGYYFFHWRKIENRTVLVTEASIPFVSVLVIGRNEAHHLRPCLELILANVYPPKKMEVIYVDDHSTDGSMEKLRAIQDPRLKVLDLKDKVSPGKKYHYKKEGIAYALEHSRGDLVLHTDADTLVGKKWIWRHALSFVAGHSFTAAPVIFNYAKGFLEHFQQFDAVASMGVTGAGIQSGFHYLANGANMSYERQKRESLNVIAGENYTSGDDVFLVQEMARAFPGKIAFLNDPEALVLTFPEKTWKNFFKQRLRWAGKSKGYRDFGLLGAEMGVFLLNTWLLLLVILSFFSASILLLFLMVFMVKIVVDALFIYSVALKLKVRLNWFYYLPSLLFYPLYYLIIGVSAIFPVRVEWKGRKIEK